MMAPTLDAYLSCFASDGAAGKSHLADTIRGLADAAVKVRLATKEGALGGAFADTRGSAHAEGDVQKDLDVLADTMFLDAARQARVAFYASEELDKAVTIAGGSRLAIAIDPLDGSSNIDTNVSIGTIFSILAAASDAERTFLQPGNRQLAAGFFIYGPQLALALTLGEGTQIFVFSNSRGVFVEAYTALVIPQTTQEFAINASNYRHWDECVQLYLDDCVQGADGPRGKDYNMRWIASLVAEAYRILIRGGVFLYPGDARKGYRHGRLRLIYEANPIAMLVEQAGGAATDGTTRILDLAPVDIHQRTPLIFGSASEVESITRYHLDPSAIGSRNPLFGKRGLLRA
jgi:fructose-1,6-bisphosphatase I